MAADSEVSPDAPLVSVVIPAREEAPDIGACIDSVLAQDWPATALEVIVVDGSSPDGTAGLARKRLEGCRLARGVVIDNPVATTPSNLNVGLAEARGEYVCRVDARSLVPRGYVRRCVEVLSDRTDIAVVGGRQLAVSPKQGPKGVGIARALNNRYTMGMSRYRRSTSSGPSDTVYLGFFRTADLRAVDGWDERMATNQDFDLNRRLSERGLIWFEASLEVGYIPRSTFGGLFAQYRRFGAAKVAYWQMTGDKPQPRQSVALAAVPLAIGTATASLAAMPRGARCRMAALGATGTVAAALTVEALGANAPAGIRVRLTSLTASAIVTGGWTLGVWSRIQALPSLLSR